MTWAEIWQAWLRQKGVVTWPTFSSRYREAATAPSGRKFAPFPERALEFSGAGLAPRLTNLPE